MTHSRNILFVINPGSGTSSKKMIRGDIQESFGPDQYSIQIEYSASRGHATEIAQKAAEQGFEIVVAAGGDGTINEVGQALVDTPVKLGIVPLGSGNGLARHLKIPLQTRQALAVIQRGKSTRIDCGLVNRRPFFCTAGVGFDALVSHEFDQAPSRGFWSYVNISLRHYVNFQPFRFKASGRDLKLDESAFVVSFANASQYGNNAQIAPSASSEDGKLNLCIVYPFKKWKGLLIAVRLILGTIETSSFYHCHLVDEFTFEASDFRYYHLDGDSYPLVSPLRVSVKPKALNVIVP